MDWKQAVNGALVRATGYQLQKVGAPTGKGAPPAKSATKTDSAPTTPRPARRRPSGERLVSQPTFILSTVRSGSTLLRVILNSHSQIHSPHELHLRDITVSVKEGHPAKALDAIGLDHRHLEYLLWDRVLHRALDASGKQHLVNKTPSDVYIADRIRECWPDARFIFLLRHPAAIAASRDDARKGQDTAERNIRTVLRYAEALEHARHTYDGLVVRYEDLTTDPEAVTQELCRFLEVPWERDMLNYGEHDHGKFRPGLGDWKDKIKSGQIQPPAPLPKPDEIPPQLHDLSRAWGYLPAEDEHAAPASVEAT